MTETKIPENVLSYLDGVAARKARQKQDIEDLKQDLIVWYLEKVKKHGVDKANSIAFGFATFHTWKFYSGDKFVMMSSLDKDENCSFENMFFYVDDIAESVDKHKRLEKLRKQLTGMKAKIFDCFANIVKNGRFEGGSMLQAIADQLGTTYFTVSTNLAGIRRRLKEELRLSDD